MKEKVKEMMCSNPFLRAANFKKLDLVRGGAESAIPFPCGKCLHCRINQARIWTHRILLELPCHNKSAFVTLTYDDDHLPEGGDLNRKDITNYIKRLRKVVSPCEIRYFGAGEYGDANYRPHYHMCIFGLGIEDTEIIKENWNNGKRGRKKELLCDKDVGIHIGEVNKNSARYVTGYILKKNTGRNDLVLREKKVPEYAFMSRRPGIGALHVEKIKKDLEKQKYYKRRVFSELKYGKNKYMPLGRYLYEKMNYGYLKEDGSPDDEIIYKKEALQYDKVYETIDKSEENKSIYYNEVLKEKAIQRLRQRKLKKIYSKGRNL